MATRTLKRAAIPAAIPTTVGEIADKGLTQITKQEIPAVPMDAKTWAKSVLADAVALTKRDSSSWTELARRIATETAVDKRTAFIAEVDAYLKRRKAEVTLMADDAESLKMAEKALKAEESRLSGLRTLAKGLNAGLTADAISGVMGKSVDLLGDSAMVTAARGFLAAQAAGDARGRKPKAVKERVADLVKACKDPSIFDKLDALNKRNLEKIVAMLATLEDPAE